MGIHRPVGERDAVGMNRRPRKAGHGQVVVFGEYVTSHDAARLADVHLIRDVVVVGELVERQADAAIALA